MLTVNLLYAESPRDPCNKNLGQQVLRTIQAVSFPYSSIALHARKLRIEILHSFFESFRIIVEIPID